MDTEHFKRKKGKRAHISTYLRHFLKFFIDNVCTVRG